MDNTYEQYMKMYQEAQEELSIALNQFNYVNPDDALAIESAIFKISSAETLVSSLYVKLKEHKGEPELCLV